MTAGRGHLVEIDAMRAFAVLAVVFYHAFSETFPGGFIGVDIFFVISGFVISRGYLAKLESGETTFAEFYKKRVRRLLPASALMLAASSIAAVFLLDPGNLVSFGWSVLAQPVFLQNFVFWSEGDYFAGPLAKPLLHTWSLAVEEQFYLLWPLLILIFRRTRQWMLIIIVLSLLSLTAGFLIEVRSPKTAFYWLPFRAWQFGLGMIAYFLVSKIPTLSRSWKTAALTGFFVFGTLASWLGGNWAQFPGIGNTGMGIVTACTLLVIASASGSAGWVYTRGPLPYIGSISYSFYLWHWPPLSLFFLHSGREASTVEASVLMVGAFLAASASYHLVENPIRYARTISPRQLVPSWLVTSLALFGVGWIFVATQGLLVRHPEKVRPFLTAALESNTSRCSYSQILRNPTAQTCVLNQASADRPTVLFVGDSHVAVIKKMLSNLGREQHITVLMTVRNCDLGRFGTFDFCNDGVLESLAAEARRESVDAIYAMSYWETEMTTPENLRRDLAKLSTVTRHITIIETVPFAEDYDPKRRIADFEETGILDYSGVERRKFRESVGEMNNLIKAGAALAGPHVRIMQPQDHLCDEERCRYAHDGQVLYFDTNHLTLAGAEQLRPMFAEDFKTIMDTN